jgi:hypothetical protein
MTSPRGIERTGWIDAKLKFPVRLKSADGAVIELHNIAEARQPNSLFEIPANFPKYDPAELIARVKKSDGWVEPVTPAP